MDRNWQYDHPQACVWSRSFFLCMVVIATLAGCLAGVVMGVVLALAFVPPHPGAQ